MMMSDMNGQACIPASDPTPLPENPVVAMAYVPYQQFNTVYSAEKALDNGTIFPELDKPFFGRRGEPR